MEVSLEQVVTRRVTPSADAGVDLRVEFAEFMQRHLPILLRKAYLLTASPFAAEDLVQDTLVRLYPSWDRVQRADVPLAYVQRSITNTFLNQRRRGVHLEVVTEVVPDQADEHSTEAELVDRDAMWTLLQTLSRRQRAVLVLRFYEGLNDLEIADHLGCRPGTVRSLISRALVTLRDRLTAA